VPKIFLGIRIGIFLFANNGLSFKVYYPYIFFSPQELIEVEVRR
jgi:hypothetical protein